MRGVRSEKRRAQRLLATGRDASRIDYGGANGRKSRVERGRERAPMSCGRGRVLMRILKRWLGERQRDVPKTVKAPGPRLAKARGSRDESLARQPKGATYVEQSVEMCSRTDLDGCCVVRRGADGRV